MYFSPEELLLYSQQIKLDHIGLAGQERLKRSRVLCIGAGGLGSPLLLYLAGAGIGTLGIIDDDVVDGSNLHRQILYRHSQLGQSKVMVAKEQLLALNPSIKINTHAVRMTTRNVTELISQYDIIADGSDNFYTRYLVHDYCFYLEKPYVFASASQFQGHCSIFYGSSGPCLRCLFPTQPNANNSLSCNEGGVVGVLPGILGMIQATEIIKWLLQLGDSLRKRLLVIDLLKMKFQDIYLSQSPDCLLCVQRTKLDKLITTDPNLYSLEKYAVSETQLPQFLQANKDILLLDVRTPEEYKAHHLGGKLIPLMELTQRLNELDIHQSILIYCQSGKRSMHALRLLLAAGFTKVNYLSSKIENI